MNDRGWVEKMIGTHGMKTPGKIVIGTRGVETSGKIMTGWENNDRVLSKEKSLVELSCTKDLEQYG